MTIEQLRDHICAALGDLPRAEQVAAIERLCMEYAGPLAQAVCEMLVALRGQPTPADECPMCMGELRCPCCDGYMRHHKEACGLALVEAQAREVVAARKDTPTPADKPLDLTLTNGWWCAIRPVQGGTWLCFAEPDNGPQMYLHPDGKWRDFLGRDNRGWPDVGAILGTLRQHGWLPQEEKIGA